MFAYTEVLYANNEIDTWNMAYSTCHSITLSDLKKGTVYLISAANIGSKGTRISELLLCLLQKLDKIILIWYCDIQLIIFQTALKCAF